MSLVHVEVGMRNYELIVGGLACFVFIAFSGLIMVRRIDCVCLCITAVEMLGRFLRKLLWGAGLCMYVYLNCCIVRVSHL